MRQRRWLDVVKDYDYEIMYRPGKAIVVAATLSRKAASTPIRDVCLRMVVTSPLLDLIKETQVEGLKNENWKVEQIRGEIPLFIMDNCGLLT